jgi:taurine dioxygenase
MTELTVVELAPTFAASVEGVDCSAEIDAATAERLRELFARYRVLVFRGQTLEPADQIRFLGLFGNVLDEHHKGDRYSLVTSDGDSVLQMGRLLFHSDSHFMPVPLEGLSLYAMHVDASSASTLFVDNVAAYERLPEATRELLDDAETVEASFYMNGEGGDRPARSVTTDYPDASRTTRPAIVRDRVTGKKFAYITELHTHHIVGMERSDSDELLAGIEAVLYEPSWMYEHQWKTGDLVVWDNITLQHARGPVPDQRIDPDAPPRSLRRAVFGSIDYRDQMALAVPLKPPF